MAAYFQLISFKTGESTSFSQIDEEICAAFAHPVDPDQYICGWYNAIGARVATGNTLDQVRTTFIGYIIEAIADPRKKNQVSYYTNLIGILNWITNNYTTNSWYSRGH
jgi:hypothetical protein